MDASNLIFFHAPQSRSAGVLTLLEELGAPYELRVLNMKAGEQRRPEFLKINPLGKVPAVLHKGALITEQVALYIYLADLFTERQRLAPSIDDLRRGAYLRWLVYYAACYEPALVDKAMKREPGLRAMSPYGDFDTMLSTVTDALASAPFLLGQEMSAADVLWGNALNWGMVFKLIPETDVITLYVSSIVNRPAAQKVASQDAVWAAEHERIAKQQG